MGNDNKRGRKAKETDYNNIFAVRLRELIDKTGKTQQGIADSIGVSRQALNKWVNGETVPDIFSAVKIADLFDVSTDYLTGRTDVSSVDADVQTACKVTGLSENSVRNLSIIKNTDKNLSYKPNNIKKIMLCPRIKIADYLISNFQFWSFCYDISCTLNDKKLFEESVFNIKETITRHIDEEIRLNPSYSEDEDLSVMDYNLDIENEEEWFEFKKWELFKHLERFSNEIIDNYEDFCIKEREQDADNNKEG